MSFFLPDFIGEFDTLRIENRIPAGIGRRFRVWLLAILLTPFPLLLAGWLSASERDSPVFLILFEVASVLVFVNSMFVPWAMLFDRRYEIDPDGISVRARISPGRIPWQSFRWVRVVASTGAASPRITFWLASRRGGIALTVDASAGAEAADRVASAVARYAPGLRRKGFTDCVKWDRAGPVDGEFVFQDDSFGELGIMFAFAGAMAAVSMQLAPLLGPEIVPAKIARAAVGLAYFVLVVVYISAANRMVSTDARSEPRRISPRARPFARFGGAAMMALSAVAAALLAA